MPDILDTVAKSVTIAAGVVAAINGLTRIINSPRQAATSLMIIRVYGPTILVVVAALLAFAGISLYVALALVLISQGIIVFNYYTSTRQPSPAETSFLAVSCAFSAMLFSLVVTSRAIERVLVGQERLAQAQLDTVTTLTRSQPPSPAPTPAVQDKQSVSDTEANDGERKNESAEPVVTSIPNGNAKKANRQDKRGSGDQQDDPPISQWTKADVIISGILTFFLVFISGLQCWAMWIQSGHMAANLRIAQDTATAARQSADLARDQMRLQQRPWISIRNVEVDPKTIATGKKVKCEFEIKNTGPSPGVIRESFVSIDLIAANPGEFGIGLADQEFYQLPEDKMNNAVAPDTTFKCEVRKTPTLTAEQAKGVRNGTLWLYMIARIVYSDSGQIPEAQGDRHMTLACLTYDHKLKRFIGPPGDNNRMT